MTEYNTLTEKSAFNGWQSITEARIGPALDYSNKPGERIARLKTRKNNTGIVSEVSVFIRTSSGSEQSKLSFGSGGDYHKTLLSRPGMRCTDKNVRELHAQALALWPAAIEEARQHYIDGKDKD